MMEIIAGIIVGVAVFLLRWYFFSTEAKNLFDEENNKQLKEDYEPTTWELAESYHIENSADWRIVSWHTYDSIVMGGAVDHNHDNYKAIAKLIARLPTLEYERHPNEYQQNKLKLEHNSAILVRNIKNGVELYIGTRDNVIRVGRDLTESSFGRAIPVEDNTSN